MQTKSIQMEWKASEDDENVVEGYAAFFNNVDSYGDVIVPGSFKASLATRKVRFLWMHDMAQPIGKIEQVFEDDKGLFLRARFANTPRAQEIRELLLSGAVDSFSIGYAAKDYDEKYDPSGKRIRVLKQIDLYEVSVVTVPANELAVVTSVKMQDLTDKEKVEVKTLEIKQVENLLRDAAGFSRNEAKAMIAGGYKALSALRDADTEEADNVIDEESKAELLSLLKKRFENQ